MWLGNRTDSNPLLHHIFLGLYFQVWGQGGEKSKIGMQGEIQSDSLLNCLIWAMFFVFSKGEWGLGTHL